MNDSPKPLEAQLGAASEGLLRDLQQLEETASLELVGRLRNELAIFRAKIESHFRAEVEKDGLHASLRQREPRLEHRVAQLAAEHDLIAQALDELLRRAEQAAALHDIVREDVRAWASQLRRHEERETDLMQEAFNTDLGAED